MPERCPTCCLSSSSLLWSMWVCVQIQCAYAWAGELTVYGILYGTYISAASCAKFGMAVKTFIWKIIKLCWLFRTHLCASHTRLRTHKLTFTERYFHSLTYSSPNPIILISFPTLLAEFFFSLFKIQFLSHCGYGMVAAEAASSNVASERA